MSEKKELGKIWVITDDDTGMYRVGEVDGGFNLGLVEHIERYGSDELLRQLAYMTSEVITIQRGVNERRSGMGQAESTAGN